MWKKIRSQWNKSSLSKREQLELQIPRSHEKDRNFHLGGRSFYFFDFDDNVAFLSTPLIIFHKETREEVKLSSSEYAKEHSQIGKSGPYKDYYIDYDDSCGTYRCFRDEKINWMDRLRGKKQMFVNDLAEALKQPDTQWKGPSWAYFYHAAFNQRPLSIITARGHHPDVIKEAIRLFVRECHLPCEPNYLGIYPVSHPQTKCELGDENFKMTVPQLKKAAIRKSVEVAIEKYGPNPYHRFGMSDDDPKNIELIIEEMTLLKKDFPQMSFFVFETSGGKIVRREIFVDHTESHSMVGQEQLTLF